MRWRRGEAEVRGAVLVLRTQLTRHNPPVRIQRHRDAQFAAVARVGRPRAVVRVRVGVRVWGQVEGQVRAQRPRAVWLGFELGSECVSTRTLKVVQQHAT